MFNDGHSFSSLHFLQFFEVIDIEFYFHNVIEYKDDTTIINSDILDNYINDKLIIGLIQEYLGNATLKLLLKINDRGNNNSYFIVEQNIFNKSLYLFHKVTISNIDLFEKHVLTVDYMTIENNNTKDTHKQRNNHITVNVLGLLDSISKKDKNPLMNWIKDDIGKDVVISKLPFFVDTSRKRKTSAYSENHERKSSEIVDPQSFFIAKYYHMLYSLNSSSRNSNKDRFYNYVKHNVKGLLLKHCDQVVKLNSASSSTSKGTTNTILYKNVIENSVLSSSELDSKYSNFDWKFKNLENNTLNQYEYEFDLKYNRNAFIFKNWNLMMNKKIDSDNQQNEDLINAVLGIFKIRELKLQIITHLELLTFTTLDSNFSKFDEIYKSSSSFAFNKTIKKNKRRKKSANGEPLDLCQRLNLLVNKLCITESLIEPSLKLSSEEQQTAALLNLDSNFNISAGKRTNEIPTKLLVNWYLKYCLFNESNDESLLGFYNNCLVLIYKKRLPKCLRYFKDKFEGTTFENSFKQDLSSESNYKSINNKKVSSLRKAPSKNLQELLNSDVSLLERQDTTFGSTQERLKLLEKRITSVPEHSPKNKFLSSKESSIDINNANGVLKNKNISINEQNGKQTNRALPEDQGETSNNIIELDGKKFKRAPLHKNNSSFQRIGSVRSFSLMDRLTQTFQEPQSSYEKIATLRNENKDNSEEKNEKEFVDDLFLKFSHRINANSQQLSYHSSDSEMVIEATPQKKSMFINSPQKSWILSSEIKAPPSFSHMEPSPLRKVTEDNTSVKGSSIISPNQLEINSTPFKTPHAAIIEAEAGAFDEKKENHSELKARRKLFP